MDFIKYTEKLIMVKYYIETKSHVTVLSLSEKLEVSGRTISRMVNHLRLQGTNIKYCRREKKYFKEK